MSCICLSGAGFTIPLGNRREPDFFPFPELGGTWFPEGFRETRFKILKFKIFYKKLEKNDKKLHFLMSSLV